MRMIHRSGSIGCFSWGDSISMTFGYGGFWFAPSWSFSYSVCFGRVWRADSFTPGRVSG